MGTTRHAGAGRKADSGQALTVDLQALFAELAQRSEESGALRAEEVAEILGVRTEVARDKIKAAIRAGKARPTKKPYQYMDGRSGLVSAYIFEV